MLTNTVFKKFAMAFMSLVMFSMMLMTVGCSENSENPIATSNTDEVVVITSPDGEQTEILQSEIDMYTVQSESYQMMIESMDPFVTENNDGTYQFDSVGFNATNQDLNSDNKEAYGELTKGIPIINKQILEERNQLGSTALSYYCSYRWWGKRCCYTGNTAWQAVAVYAAAGFIPGIGWIPGIISIYFGYYAQVYGGFCINQSWVGGYWVTRP